MCSRRQRQDGRGALLAKLSPLEEKQMGMRGSCCDSDGRWDMLALSRAGPGLQCQFSCSLCVTAGVLPGMSLLLLAASFCHLLDSLSAQPDSAGVSATTSGCCPIGGEGKLSHWMPETGPTFLAAVLDLSFCEYHFEP